MSFAQDVKKEIAILNLSNNDLKAELYAIIRLKANLTISIGKLGLEIKTKSIALARRIILLFKKIYEINIDLLAKEEKKLDRKKLYYLLITEKAEDILNDLKIMRDDFNIQNEINNIYDNYSISIIRGMFLASGSINDPNKSNYHLEIVCNKEEESNYILDVLSKYQIYAKTIIRRDSFVVYIKKAEQIGDFLKMIGANNMLFYFENERIKRDLNNVVNRMYNCDLANSDKSLLSANRQLQAIKKIEEKKGYSILSPRLMEAVILRTNHPDASLQELSDLSEETTGRYLSKSGINHCLKDILDIANNL